MTKLSEPNPGSAQTAQIPPSEGPFQRSVARFLPRTFDLEKAAPRLLGVLVVYAAIRSALGAASQPFSGDEIITMAIGHLPTLSALWKALNSGADGQPPLFYLIERGFAALYSNPHVGYRLPSIAAYCCTLVCVFSFVKRRSGAVCGLLCAIALFTTSLFGEFTTQARPYSLITAALAMAMVSYQGAPSFAWTLVLFLSLASAISFHYYGLFFLGAFLCAEAAFFLFNRKLRLGVWLAVICSGLALVPSLPLLLSLRQIYGAHWARPSLIGTFRAYGSLIHVPGPAGIGILGLLVLGLGVVLGADLTEFRGVMRSRDTTFHEHVLALALLLLPFGVFVAVKITQGGFLDRYVLWLVVPVVVSVGFILPRLGRSGLMVFGAYLLVCLAAQEIPFLRTVAGHVGRVASPAAGLKEFIDSAGHLDLPVVITIDNSVVSYYAPETRDRYVSLVDIPSAKEYMGTDEENRLTLILRPYLPVHVFEFAEFAASYRQFLVYSNGGFDSVGSASFYDWWTPRLVHDGYSVEVVAADHTQKVYLVNLDKKTN